MHFGDCRLYTEAAGAVERLKCADSPDKICNMYSVIVITVIVITVLVHSNRSTQDRDRQKQTQNQTHQITGRE